MWAGGKNCPSLLVICCWLCGLDNLLSCLFFSDYTSKRLLFRFKKWQNIITFHYSFYSYNYFLLPRGYVACKTGWGTPGRGCWCRATNKTLTVSVDGVSAGLHPLLKLWNRTVCVPKSTADTFISSVATMEQLHQPQRGEVGDTPAEINGVLLFFFPSHVVFRCDCGTPWT